MNMNGVKSQVEKIQECNRCLLNNTDTTDITFNDEGVCSYCLYFDSCMRELGDSDSRKLTLQNKINEIKEAGKGKKYDCLIGLSGGVDSSYVALLAHELGLRPLAIHLDNGWNSDIAVQNIERICEKFNFDLHTQVIDWEEFLTLQRAYLIAGVIDIEVLTDHAIKAIHADLSRKYDVKYSLSGFNYITEAIMPKGWNYDKLDFSNIKDIVFQFGGIKKFTSYPTLSFYKQLYNYWLGGYETFRILNYIEFEREKAIQELEDTVGWRNYGMKHHESFFTKFYQEYILPNKFMVNKRKAHLSNLVTAGTLLKEEAKSILFDKNCSYQVSEEDILYFKKKMKLSDLDFERIMSESPRPHKEFATDKSLWDKYFGLLRTVKRIFGQK